MPKKPDFEILDHTADVGVRAWGKGPAEALRNASLGMLQLIYDPSTVKINESREIEAVGRDWPSLLVAFLQEVLYLVEAEGWAIRDLEMVEVSEYRARARLQGEDLDPERHLVSGEIKAPTYHMIKFEKDNDHWTAQVYFDV